MAVLKIMLPEDSGNVSTFVQQFFSAEKNLPVDFTDKCCRLLRDERIQGDLSGDLVTVHFNLVRALPDVLSTQYFVDELRLPLYLMLACRRQVCSSQDDFEAQHFIVQSLQIIL